MSSPSSTSSHRPLAWWRGADRFSWESAIHDSLSRAAPRSVSGVQVDGPPPLSRQPSLRINDVGPLRATFAIIMNAARLALVPVGAGRSIPATGQRAPGPSPLRNSVTTAIWSSAIRAGA